MILSVDLAIYIQSISFSHIVTALGPVSYTHLVPSKDTAWYDAYRSSRVRNQVGTDGRRQFAQHEVKNQVAKAGTADT